MKLKLKTAVQRSKEKLAAWLGVVNSYEFKRTVWNAQRRPQHPAMMSASRRRKLKRN